MAHRAALPLISGLLAASLAAPLAAQLGPPPPPQTPARDPIPAPSRIGGPARGPMERSMPVGSASITGVVTTVDTARPIAGARVQLNGTAGNPAALEALLTQIRGASRGAGPVGMNLAMGRGDNPTTATLNGVTFNISQLSVSVSRSVVTDAQGVFTFQRLPAGTFSINVNKNQFLNTNYGQKRPGGQGTPIAIVDGQQLKLTVPMSRGGVIAGQVFGPDGEPQTNAQVSAWRFQYNNGVRRIYQQNGAQTDDRGTFRIHGLQPGDYLIGARPNMDYSFNDQTDVIENAIASGTVKPPLAPGLPSTVTFTVMPPTSGPIEQPPSFLPTYYGGSTTRTGAQIIHVNGDDERLGVDIVTQPIRATNVTGIVAMPPMPGVRVQVSVTSDDPMQPMSFGSTSVQPDGKFTLRELAPGKYTVIAITMPAPTPPPMQVMGSGVVAPPIPQPRPQLDNSQKMWGRAVVNVSGEPTVTVNLALQPARSISGVVISEMSRPPDFSRLQVTLMQAPGSDGPTFGPQPSAPVSADGRFTLGGVTPGKYVLRASSTMKSSLVDGKDSLDYPLEVTGERDFDDAVITITDKFTQLTGTLSEGGKPAVGYSIVAVPTDQRFWTPGSRRIVMTRPGFDGKFVFGNLPPGDYFLAAAAEFESGMQYDPEFLKALTVGAVRVTLMEGETRTQDLRVAIR